jgi:hypothetical protein
VSKRSIDAQRTRIARRSLLLPLLAVVGTALLGARALAADDDILFTATLSDEDQSIPTYSPGKGFAEIRLERATLKITWNVTYEGLTSPAVVAGLYGPENVGANAGQFVDLGVNGLRSPLRGSKVLSDGEFQYLITGRVYVNIHTTKYREGELRGQLRRQRSKAAPADAPKAAAPKG